MFADNAGTTGGYWHSSKNRLCLALLVASCFSTQHPASHAAPSAPVSVQPENIMTLSKGTTLLTYASEYSAAQWSSFNIFDGNPESGWCSATGTANNNTFLVDLPQRYDLVSIAIDNAGVQDKEYPGISAKTIEIWGSTKSSTSGFTLFATVTAARAARKEFAIKGQAQWLRIVVKDNYGDKKYTEMMEFEAYGKPVGTATTPALTGIYETNYGPMKLKQTGTHIAGCYVWKGVDRISGSAYGRAFVAQWDQGKNDVGTALMTVSSDGKVLNGVWYRNGAQEGEWRGTRNDKAACNCTPAGTEQSQIDADLQARGRSIIYGIHFDVDSDKLRSESDSTLQAILQTLKATPNRKLVIEGHTDSTNTEEYNQKLSERRAKAVVAWLVSHGISSSTLTAKGLGETKPVAANTTPQGRALNRRVELSLAK
ncbi:MAG: OmpA family protein [Candidatus Obscuribacterales bacterium]